MPQVKQKSQKQHLASLRRILKSILISEKKSLDHLVIAKKIIIELQAGDANGKPTA
jgi:hypothetical protein